MLKSFGSVVDTGGSLMRIFTYESSIQELSRIAMKKNLFFSVSPITLDDVFVYIGWISRMMRRIVMTMNYECRLSWDQKATYSH